MEMTLKVIRIELQRLALELEKVEDEQYPYIPKHVFTYLDTLKHALESKQKRG